ncbi:MAG: PocR ligand-binding domain-containing protein [Clostridiales bacterium]
MLTNNETYDIQQAQTLAKDYTNATGVECLLVKGDTIYNPCPGAIHKEFCYQKDSEIANYCLNLHKNGAATAKNKGTCISYFCPMGLMHWASPIVVHGQIQGIFIAGHVFFDNTRENIIKRKNLSTLHEKLLAKYPELKNSLLSSIVIDENRLESLKHILDMMALNLSEDKANPMRINEIENLLNQETQQSVQQNLMGENWQKLSAAINSGQPMDIDEALKNIVAEISQNTESIKEHKNNITALIFMLHNKCDDKNAPNPITDHCINALSELEYIDNSEKLAPWAKKKIRSLLESAYYLPSMKNANMVYSALHYIHLNFRDHMTLQEISDYVHFSPPYFSKMFKKELNMTFTQYLTKVRIEESKHLLADTSTSLSDIPGLVGFEEQSYFTKVFRAVTGISPGKYRDQIIS